MNNNNRILLLIIGIAISPFLFAQENSTADWSLKKCIDFALQNNLNVQRSIYNVESSNISYNQTRLNQLPNLNASTSTGFNWGRSIDPTSNQFITQRIHSVSAGLSSSVTLFNGMRLKNTVQQNKLSFEASKSNLEKVKNDIIQNVVLFYVNVIFNKEIFENAKLQLASTEESVTVTQKRVDAGALPKSNLLDLLAQKSTNEVNVVNTENSYNLSLLQLKQLLQLPASTSFSIETPQVDVDNNIVLDISSEEIYNVSLSSMPEIKNADLNVESAEYGTRAAKGNLYPTLSLNAGIRTNYSDAADIDRFVPDGGTPTIFPTPQIGIVGDGSNTPVYSIEDITVPSGELINGYNFSDQFSDNISEFVSINLSIPIFNGYQARYGVQRALINKRQAEITSQEIRNTLRQSVERAYNDVLAAAKSYQASLKQVEAREEAFRVTQKRLENNAINNTEYQIAENTLFQAKSDLLRAKYDYIFKLKILDFYQGKPLDF
ncbi:MAG: TolC family protein [Cyclobacteriaceae bacterium]|nr:TolC family protein [Cyclobacteriaceae bacterium]